MSHFVEGLGFGGISKEKGRPWGSTGYSAILAAGAVITKDVPAYAVAAGNPARIVKVLKEN